MKKKSSYSVINTHKSMLVQTLQFFGVEWVKTPTFLSRLLRGYFNLKPSVPRCIKSWDVSLVLKLLKSWMPLKDLSLKFLTFKLITLVALTTASRAQTLLALDIRHMSIFTDRIVFQVNTLLKTSRPGVPLPKVYLYKYQNPELCVVLTLIEYLKMTSSRRKSSSLFVSHKTFLRVSTSTLARWLKTVLNLSGIDDSRFKAHSFRSTAASVAFDAGGGVRSG